MDIFGPSCCDGLSMQRIKLRLFDLIHTKWNGWLPKNSKRGIYLHVLTRFDSVCGINPYLYRLVRDRKRDIYGRLYPLQDHRIFRLLDVGAIPYLDYSVWHNLTNTQISQTGKSTIN